VGSVFIGNGESTYNNKWDDAAEGTSETFSKTMSLKTNIMYIIINYIAFGLLSCRSFLLCNKG